MHIEQRFIRIDTNMQPRRQSTPAAGELAHRSGARHGDSLCACLEETRMWLPTTYQDY